jgi:hypothetical protein
VVFVGPETEAQQVAALLSAQGFHARIHSQAGGVEPWKLSGPFDSRVVVPPGQAQRALRLLGRNPRWAPVDSDSEARSAQDAYRFFVAAVVVVGLAGLGLVLFVLLH